MATPNGVACERLPSRREYLSAGVMPFRSPLCIFDLVESTRRSALRPA